MTTTRQDGSLNRFTTQTAAPTEMDSGSWMSYGYRYNSANQRDRLTSADGSYWVYGYDALGQVISGKRYWSDGTPVAPPAPPWFQIRRCQAQSDLQFPFPASRPRGFA